MADQKAPEQPKGEKQAIKQIKPSHMNQGNQTFYPGRQPANDKPQKQEEEPSKKAS